MIYLYWYLGIGGVVLAIVIGAHCRTMTGDWKSLGDSINAMYPKRKRFMRHILQNVVVPALAAVAVVVVWPAAIFMQIKDLLTDKSVDAKTSTGKFTVRRGDLRAQLSIAEIEACERVTDPFGAVPPLPFGHLNPAWMAFLKGITPEDAIWSFSAVWTNCGRTDFRTGYVAVRGNSIGAHILTQRQDISDRIDDGFVR